MIRDLYIVNNNGEKYNLLDYRQSPTYQVNGFGFEDDTSFLRIGDNYLPLEEKTVQKTINMTLIFWNDHDKTYDKFVKLARKAPLKLGLTNDNGTYEIPCRLKSADKTDKLGYTMHACEVTFIALGNIYKVVNAVSKIPSQSATGKVYPYTYNYTYSSDFVNTVVIESDSAKKSPCTLTIYGEAETPIWRHYVNDKIVETGQYNGTIASGNYLVIDTKSIPYRIEEYNSSGVLVADRYSSCDFSTKRFMYLYEGQNRFSVSNTGDTSVIVKIEGYIEYDSV